MLWRLRVAARLGLCPCHAAPQCLRRMLSVCAGKASVMRLALHPFLLPMSGLFELLSLHARAHELLIMDVLMRLLE